MDVIRHDRKRCVRKLLQGAAAQGIGVKLKGCRADWRDEVDRNWVPPSTVRFGRLFDKLEGNPWHTCQANGQPAPRNLASPHDVARRPKRLIHYFARRLAKCSS